MTSRTFTIIKPNAVSLGYTGKIIDMILEAGFVIRAMKMVFMSRNDAAKFYHIHKGKPFYDKLLTFMSSGASVMMILEKENAVGDFRKLVGDTDPKKAEPGTIRNLYGEDKTRNSIHASDSESNAVEEWTGFFFLNSDIMDADYVCMVSGA